MADQMLDMLNSIFNRLNSIDTSLRQIGSRLARTDQLALLCAIQTGGLIDMTLKVEDILAKVEAQGTVITSVETAMNEVAARLHEALANTPPDPAVLQKIADELDANASRIGAAAALGTSAAHEVPGGQVPAAPPATDPTAQPTSGTDPNAPTT